MKGLWKVCDGMMHGCASSLLYQQHFQDGLHAVEKYSLRTVLEALICKKRRNIGMLSAIASPYYPPQNNDCERKITEKKQSQNDTGHDNLIAPEKNANQHEKAGNAQINKGKHFKRRHSHPVSTTSTCMDNNPHAASGERNEDNDNAKDESEVANKENHKTKKKKNRRKKRNKHNVEEMPVESVGAHITGCNKCAQHNDELEETLWEVERLATEAESCDNALGECESRSTYYEMIACINKEENDYARSQMDEKSCEKIVGCEILKESMVGCDLFKEEYDNLKAESMSSMNKLKRRPAQKERNEKKNADDEWKEAARMMKKE